MLAVRAPSETVTVMAAVPLWPGSGVRMTVRLVPLPPKTMLAPGISAVLPDVPETVREAAAVSAGVVELQAASAAQFVRQMRVAMRRVMVASSGFGTR